MKVAVAVLGVPNKATVSVDVKQHSTNPFVFIAGTMSASLWHVVLLAVYGLSSVTSSPIAGDEKSEEKRSGQCITELYRRKKERKKKVCSGWEECCLFFVFVLGCCWDFCLFSVLVYVCGGGGGGWGGVAVCLLVLEFFGFLLLLLLVGLLFFHFFVILPQTYQCWSLFIQHASVKHPLRYNTFAHSFIPLCIMVFLLYYIHIAQW